MVLALDISYVEHWVADGNLEETYLIYFFKVGCNNKLIFIYVYTVPIYIYIFNWT